jgi:hypothetical protein
MIRRSWCGALILVVLEVPLLAAQLELEAVGGGVGLHSAVSAFSDHVTGPAFGVEGGAGMGMLFLDVRYLDGSLSPGVENLANHDVVDGRVDAGARPLPWLALDAGPHLRAYGGGGVTERWVLWELRGRADVSLISGIASGHLELSRALAASVNVPQPVDYAQGGAIGLTVRPGRAPYRLGLDYEIDDAEFTGVARHETFEAVFLHVGVALP